MPESDKKGRYASHIEDMRQNSKVAQVVLNELDLFWERVTETLNRMRVEENDPETVDALVAVKTDIKAAIAARFGTPASSVAVAMKRSISGWNLFDSENRQKVREDLQLSGQRMCLLLLTDFSGRL
jgi:hypothetical protein